MRCVPLVLTTILLGSSAATVAQNSDQKLGALNEFVDAAQLEPDPERGAKLFETCAACHGQDGTGTGDGEVPAIAGQHGSVLLKQLTDFRHQQRRDERMQYFTDRHHLPGPQELTDVAAYVAGLPRFPRTGSGIGDGTSLGEGASVYFRECERCHGPLGKGDLLTRRPRLAGQHYLYLLRQLEDTAQKRRPGMDAAHVEMLRRMSPVQLRGVADYLSRVSPDLSSVKRP
jgi:cytochrome c553